MVDFEILRGNLGGNLLLTLKATSDDVTLEATVWFEVFGEQIQVSAIYRFVFIWQDEL